MSRLWSHRFHVKYNLQSVRKSFLSTPRVKPQQSGHRSVFIHQQRGYAGRFNTVSFGHRLKSTVWICGVGVGIAVAVGLKYRSDAVDYSYDDKTSAARRINRYRDAIDVSRDLLERQKAEVGAPGVVVGVSVDGAPVWCEGIGYADLENRVPCSPQTMFRIASISKPLTTAAAARLCEEGKLDLDASVQKYVPEFPQKQFDGQNVTITPRMIMSHLSGIRHYEKDACKVKESMEKAKRLLKVPVREDDKAQAATEKNPKDKESVQPQKDEDFASVEFYLKDKFESVTEALDLFKDDPLIFRPGTTYLYSTHAFTLLSAVMERAAGRSFLDLMMNMFHELGMVNTVPEENDPIIYHRSRNYHFNKKGRVVNCPYVDNSYKWAGGGYLSTVGDLLLFGNALLYSYQVKDTDGVLPGFLKPQTAIDLWTPSDKTGELWVRDGLYAQGWVVVEKGQKFGQCRKRRHYVSHTGAAVGASSVLLLLPSEEMNERKGQTFTAPQGVVVTILTNMESVGLSSTALKIANEFDKARSL
ncbi:serine beta-lactamase-like protein LACTB, mitochondrial isoform X2 [Antennarius striatus]|uniref:serine beta-lactamase-like protein LACTB, mitochondrial isoform X2 n=1 Tax=Antennarius striatus TaxID=241820 RepID=UPI0035B14750